MLADDGGVGRRTWITRGWAPRVPAAAGVWAKANRPGHLGISEPEGQAPTVLSVECSVDGPDVLIRAGEGLFARIAGRVVAFEVHGWRTAGPGARWCKASPGSDDSEGAGRLGGRMPVPWVDEPGWRIVRTRSDVVSGRRLGEAAGGSVGLTS